MKTRQTGVASAVAAVALLLGGATGVRAEDGAAVRPAATGVPRVLTWRVTPRPEALLLYRCAGAAPLVFAPDAVTGAIRFLACPGDVALLACKRTHPVQGQEKADAQSEQEEGQFLLFVDAADGGELALTLDPDWAFVRQDGHPIGLLVEPSGGTCLSAAALPLRLAALTAEDLRAFRLLILESGAAEGNADAGAEAGEAALQRAFAQRLGEARPPRLTVCIQGEKDPGPALASLDPVSLFYGDHAPAGMLPGLAGKRVENLLVTGGLGAADLAALAKLPRLRNLQIWGQDKAEPPLQLPDGLAIEALGVGGEAAGVGGLAQQKGLVRLAAPAEELASLDLRATFPRLASLSTAVSKLPTVPAGLRHLGFIQDTGVTVELLAKVVKANPDLVAIEFMNCNELTDLSALKGLPGLESLLFVRTPVADTKTLAELKGTRFIALPAKDFFEGEGSEALKELKARRPEATIVPVDALCLGSGWIVLLLPVMAVGALLARRGLR